MRKPFVVCLFVMVGLGIGARLATVARAETADEQELRQGMLLCLPHLKAGGVKDGVSRYQAGWENCDDIDKAYDAMVKNPSHSANTHQQNAINDLAGKLKK